MTNRRWCTRAASLVLSLLVSGSVVAQEQPRSLLPGFLGSDADAPPPANTPVQPLFPPGRAPAGIATESPAIGPAPAAGSQSLGTLPLGAAVQAGIGLLDPVLQRYAGPLPAAPLQRAVRGLLLDPALRDAAGPLVRARALYALGFLEDATGAAVEGRPASVADRAAMARMFLGLGRIGQACERADVDRLPEGAEPGPTFELLEVLALCQLEQGQADAARLIVDVLREQGGSDRLFRTLMATVQGRKADLPKASSVSRVRPVHMVLMRKAGLAPPPGYAAKLDLALVPALARDEAADMAARIVAAERAVEAGLLDVGVLVGLYATTPLEEAMLMQAATGKAPQGSLGRAHLFALIAEAPDDAERMRLVTAMTQQAWKAGVGRAVGAAVSEDVAGIVPAPDLAGFASVAVESLVIGERPNVALGWIDAGNLPGADGRPGLSPIESHRLRAMTALSAPALGLGVGAGALGADAGGASVSKADRAFIARVAAFQSVFGDRVSPVLYELGGRDAQVPPVPPGTSAIRVLEALAPLAGADWMTVGAAESATALGTLSSFGGDADARLAAAWALAAFSPH